jgi:hypothetical protein
MRAPPLSLRPMTGAPTFMAMSMTLQIFCAWRSLSEPPNTVKSCAKTKTSRPLIVPDPVTTPSPGTFCSAMPKSVALCSTNMSYSSKLSESSSTVSRSRASAAPSCAARRSAPVHRPAAPARAAAPVLRSWSPWQRVKDRGATKVKRGLLAFKGRLALLRKAKTARLKSSVSPAPAAPPAPPTASRQRQLPASRARRRIRPSARVGPRAKVVARRMGFLGQELVLHHPADQAP